MRALTIAAASTLVTAAILTLTGCSPPFAPMAVTSIASVPAVVWKFCDQDESMASMQVSRVTDEDPESWPTVWSARQRADSTPRSPLLITDEVDGYVVTTGTGWPLQGGVRYAITQAADQCGVNVLADVAAFRLADLTDGKVLADEHDGQDLQAWLGSDGPPCR